MELAQYAWRKDTRRFLIAMRIRKRALDQAVTARLNDGLKQVRREERAQQKAQAKKTHGPAVVGFLEPHNKESIGYALWLILSERKTKRADAAKFLSINPCILSQIIHGHEKLTAKRYLRDGWRAALAANCPEGWTKHRVFFDALWAAQCAKKIDMREAKSLWQHAAGDFIKKIHRERGDKIEDFLPAVHAHILKEKNIWEKIEAADPTIKPHVVKSAVSELCTIYDLTRSRDVTMRTAASLLLAL